MTLRSKVDALPTELAKYPLPDETLKGLLKVVLKSQLEVDHLLGWGPVF